MDQFGRGSADINDFLNQQQGQRPSPTASQQQQWSASDFNSYMQQQQQQQQQQVGFNSNSLGAIYVSNILPPPSLMSQQHSQQQQQQQQAPPQQQFDQNGQPIKIRKKPGRKPNPASPALRKAQNRAAQRAFRERKERHLKDLEGTIRQLREQRNSAVKELNQTKSKMDSYRAENWYLKGVMLTLQFVCLHHSIHIPTHSPYLTEEALSEMAKTTPHAIEAYVNAYTRNNINLKPTMAAHFANSSPSPTEEKDLPDHDLVKEGRKSGYREEDMMMDDEEEGGQEERDYDEEGEEDGDDYSQAATDRRRSSHKNNSLSPGASDYIKIEADEMDEGTSQWVKQHDKNKKKREQEKKEAVAAEEKQQQQPNADSISAIQRIRLQLRIQSTVTGISNKSKLRLQPTILQLAIPHDPRIDLIPTPHMRDRMIIFRDQMDYDKCFAMLLNGAMYHGGDPTMSASWELPAEFFTEFWYLAINYDVNRTNTWRRLKGLPEIRGGPVLSKEQEQQLYQQQQQVWNSQQQQQQQQENDNASSSQYTVESTNARAARNNSSDTSTVWTDDVFAQMTAGMPTLQPLDSNHLTSGFDFGSPPSTVMFDDHLYHQYQSNHPLFDQYMGSSPEVSSAAKHHDRSPSIGAMMDLMNTLSTDMSQQQH